MPKQTTYHIRRVLEYSEFFKDVSPIDIPATLKLYSRNTLLRMAAILSLHYGNMHVPDNERSLFSDCSKKHIPHINELFQLYYKRIGIDSNHVPITELGIFNETPIGNATLYVPGESMNAYKTNDPRNRFGNIKTLTTGILRDIGKSVAPR